MLPLTSSPLGIRRLEMMMILSSLSNVTTSATQLGAQEWLMYLGSGTKSETPSNWVGWFWFPVGPPPECHPRGLLNPFLLIPLSPGRASSQRSINDMFVVYSKHVDASILERQRLQRKGQEYQRMAAAVARSRSGLGQWAYLHFLFFHSPASPLLFPQLSTCPSGPNPAPCPLAKCGPRTMMAPLPAHTCSS